MDTSNSDESNSYLDKTSVIVKEEKLVTCNTELPVKLKQEVIDETLQKQSDDLYVIDYVIIENEYTSDEPDTKVSCEDKIKKTKVTKVELEDTPNENLQQNTEVPNENIVHATNEAPADIKHYDCDQCGVVFNEYWELAKHMWIHSSEKPFNCDKCNKKFGHLDNLNKHLRIHTGMKPYFCKECGKSFNGNSDLRRHLRIHTGYKPYKCTHCSKAFARSDYLKKHLQKHAVKK